MEICKGTDQKYFQIAIQLEKFTECPAGQIVKCKLNKKKQGGSVFKTATFGLLRKQYKTISSAQTATSILLGICCRIRAVQMLKRRGDIMAL